MGQNPGRNGQRKRMTADEDLLLLAKYILKRFGGLTPTDDELAVAVVDWRKEAYSWPKKNKKVL